VQCQECSPTGHGRLGRWARTGDEISKAFGRICHECVHLAVHVAAEARGVGHHPDIDIRWRRIRFGITTRDAGHRITDLDFALARHIDAMAAGHGATPVPAGDAWLPRPGCAVVATMPTMRGSVVAVSRAAARADCPIRLTGRSGASGAGCGQQTTPDPEGTPSLAAIPGGEPSHGAICMTPGC